MFIWSFFETGDTYMGENTHRQSVSHRQCFMSFNLCQSTPSSVLVCLLYIVLSFKNGLL